MLCFSPKHHVSVSKQIEKIPVAKMFLFKCFLFHISWSGKASKHELDLIMAGLFDTLFWMPSVLSGKVLFPLLINVAGVFELVLGVRSVWSLIFCVIRSGCILQSILFLHENSYCYSWQRHSSPFIMQIVIRVPVFGIKYNHQTFGWGSEQAGLGDDVPAHCRGLDWMALKGLFHPQLFCDNRSFHYFPVL